MKLKSNNVIALIILSLPVFTILDNKSFESNKETSVMEFKLFSPAFDEGKLIPAKYTCDGINVSPPLKWINPPGNTKSYALICNDPDAPSGDWVHWIVYNIPSSTGEINEAASSKKLLPKGTLEGMNDFHKISYGGPCPPSGTHRYFFRLYSLNTILSSQEGLKKIQLLQLIKDHILAQATLIGKYERQ